MKNTSYSILIALFIAATFTPISLAQYSPGGDSPDGEKARVRKGKLHIYDVKYSPDSTRVAVAGSFGIRLYDVQTGEEPVQFIGHRGKKVWSVAFSPDGKRFVSGGQDNTIRLWDVNTGKLLRTITERAWSVAFSPDGTTIASGDWIQTISLWDVNTGKRLLTLPGHTIKLWSLAFSPDGRMLASCGCDYNTGSGYDSIRLWDVKTGKHIRTIGEEAAGNGITDVAFSPDGKTIASASSSILRLWDVKTGKHIRTFTEDAASVWRVAFSPDGKTIASANIGAIIGLWDVETGKLLRTISGQGCVGKVVAFSPDGKTIASGGWQVAYLWDANTGQRLRTLIKDY